MRFVADRNSLLRALGHITGIVERRNTIPILSNVLTSAEADGRLTLKATDLDMEAIETLPAKVETPGAVTIPAHTLHDIVRKLPEGAEIHVEREGRRTGRLKVMAGRASFELAVLPADEFPELGQAGATSPFHGGGRRTEASVREGPVRDLDRRNALLSEWYLSASRRRRGRAETQCGRDRRSPARSSGDRSAKRHRRHAGVIVPRKAVAEIIKLLDDGQAPVEVSLSHAKIRFAAGDVVLTSKLIDGSFPDYARVIPTAIRSSCWSKMPTS